MSRQRKHAQRQQQPLTSRRTTPPEQLQAPRTQDEGGALLFFTNLLIGALISWGLLHASSYFEGFFNTSPPQQADPGAHALLGSNKDAASVPGSRFGDSEEGRAAAARFLLDRWAASDRGKGEKQQLQHQGKGLGLYHPQLQRPPSHTLLQAGQLIQDRYVLQDFIQELGGLTMESARMHACV